MARERRSSGKTSFGKRTQAEKNFRERKATKPERDSGSEDRPRKRSFSRDEKPFARKSTSSFHKRSDNEGRGSRTGFRKSGSDRFSKFDKGDNRGKGAFSGSRREKPFGDKREKPAFRKREDGAGERSFGKRSGSYGDKREKPSFPRRDEGSGERRFEKRASSGERRFSKKEDSGEKRFDRRESTGESRFSKRDEGSGVRKFSRADVKKVDGGFSKDRGEGGERPQFSKSEKRERSSNYGKPFRVREKKKSFGGPKQEHQRKNIDAGVKPDDGLIRLNKFMANSGVGSRREADEYIKMGLVTVNGVTVTEMGHKVKATDDVRYEGRKLKAEPLVYVLLNKPKGFITTTDDPEERNTVMDLVASACKERIYPVGRLDRNTTGLLLLTNDGDLADKLTHPSYNVKKIYKVELDRPLTKNDLQKILDGVYFEEGKAQVDDIAIVSDDGKEIGIELHIGWNRIVRRIFEALGYEIQRLDRVAYAGLDKKDLGRGQWRFLKPEEVVTLKHFR